jgi:cobalt/nickel transport system permease protein
MLGFVLAVVATPREQVWAFAVHAAVLVAVVATARLPAGLVAKRMVVEVPFVVFALLLPFVAQGERVSVPLGTWQLSLSEPGLWGAWNVLAKGSLGVVAAIVLAATTRPRDLVTGLQRLRVPALFVTILHFMIRYLDIVIDDMARMRIARESRGFRPRHAGQIPVVARSAGALFVRAYERGERVHRAMLSRGYSGVMPASDASPTTTYDRLAAVSLPLTAAAVAAAAALVAAGVLAP